MRRIAAHDSGVHVVAFSADGRLLATASRDGTAKVWVAASGDLVTTLRGEADSMDSMVFNYDGSLIGTAGINTARLWSTRTGNQVAAYEHPDQVWSVAFNNDGTLLATVGYEGESHSVVRLWDTREGRSVATLDDGSGNVDAVAFDPSGHRLLTVGSDAGHVWSIATREVESTFSGHDGVLSEVAFSHDRTRVATLGLEGTSQVWDPATGLQVATLSHTGTFGKLALSPDGSRLTTIDPDGTARLSDATSGEPIAALSAATEALAFDPGGALVAAGRGDGSVDLWSRDATRLAAGTTVGSRGRPHVAVSAGRPSTARPVTRNPPGAICTVWATTTATRGAPADTTTTAPDRRHRRGGVAVGQASRPHSHRSQPTQPPWPPRAAYQPRTRVRVLNGMPEARVQPDSAPAGPVPHPPAWPVRPSSKSTGRFPHVETRTGSATSRDGFGEAAGGDRSVRAGLTA